jgi:HK97 family phage major capsid protein
VSSNKEKRSALIAQANQLVNKPGTYSKEDNVRVESLLRLADALAVDPLVTDEKREETKYFRDLILGPEIRTYSPMSTSADSQLIAQGFERDIKTLMLSDGPLFAGSPLLSNVYAQKMNPSKLPVSDDLSSTGYVLTENSGPATSEAELNFSSVLFGSSTFSSGIILVSTSLSEDLEAWTTTENLVKRTASARLSRIMNNTWLAALKTALALNSSAAVSAFSSTVIGTDIFALVSAVGTSYRTSPSCAFVMSPAQQPAIGALVASGSGLREFPDVLSASPTILGYPVHVIAGASAKDIIFGDFSFAMSKSMPIELQTLKERFVVEGYLGLILRQRADFKWSVATTSDSPVKTLSFS